LCAIRREHETAGRLESETDTLGALEADLGEDAVDLRTIGELDGMLVAAAAKCDVGDVTEEMVLAGVGRTEPNCRRPHHQQRRGLLSV
jgi:hypothetical protein